MGKKAVPVYPAYPNLSFYNMVEASKKHKKAAAVE